MKDIEIKQIVALVFIRAEKEYPEASSKSQLAEKLTQSNPHFSGVIGAKSLVNYFNYFLDNGSSVVNPSQDSIEAMLQYVGYHSVRQFKENPPSASQIRKVPFLSKEEHTTYEKNQERYENSQKQENISNTTINKNSHNHEENVVIGKVDNSINKNAVVIIAILTVLAIVVGVIMFFSQDKLITVHTNQIIPNKIKEKNCAFWNGQQYIKEYCQNSSQENLQPLSDLKVSIDFFKKVYPSTYNEFFTPNGKPKIWYGYYYDQLEFFNAKGNHPITQEPLQPITEKLVIQYLNLSPGEDKELVKNVLPRVKKEPQLNSSNTEENRVITEKTTENIPKSTPKPHTETSPKTPPCEQNNTGDFCFQNQTGKDLKISMELYNNSPLASVSKFITVSSQEEGCFYDLPMGVYVYTSQEADNYIRQKQGQVKLQSCQSGSRDLK